MEISLSQKVLSLCLASFTKTCLNTNEAIPRDILKNIAGGGLQGILGKAFFRPLAQMIAIPEFFFGNRDAAKASLAGRIIKAATVFPTCSSYRNLSLHVVGMICLYRQILQILPEMLSQDDIITKVCLPLFLIPTLWGLNEMSKDIATFATPQNPSIQSSWQTTVTTHTAEEFAELLRSARVPANTSLENLSEENLSDEQNCAFNRLHTATFFERAAREILSSDTPFPTQEFLNRLDAPDLALFNQALERVSAEMEAARNQPRNQHGTTTAQ